MDGVAFAIALVGDVGLVAAVQQDGGYADTAVVGVAAFLDIPLSFVVDVDDSKDFCHDEDDGSTLLLLMMILMMVLAIVVVVAAAEAVAVVFEVPH